MSYASRKYKLTRHDPCLTEDEEAAERAHEAEQQQQQLLHQQQQAEQRQQQQAVDHQQQLVTQALSQLKSQMQSDEAAASAAAQAAHTAHDDDDMELDAAHLHDQTTHSEKAVAVRKELIVLDGANVAWCHGVHLVSSLEGIILALQWFEHRGFRTVAFLPQSYLRGKYDKHATSAIATAVAARLQGGSIVLTPAYDSDDAYMISFAQQHGGYLVTNDMLRDHVESAGSQDQIHR
jgi:Zc3h12a-like Ribonuclease NYN domain